MRVRWWHGPALWIRDPGAALAAIGRNPVALAIILGIGLVVRIGAIQQARLDDDESQFWEAALNIAEGKNFPVLGHPITGSPAAHPGALFYYLIAIPQLFSSDPLAGSLFVALLNVLGLWLVFLAVREAWNDRAAAIFLLLAIASPWTVVYGDRIWPGNLFFLLCAIVVFTVTRMVVRERSRTCGLLAFTLVAGMQIHLSTLQLWFVAIVPLLLYRPRISLSWLLAGLALGAATYVPYLLHELNTNFSNTKLMLQYTSGSARTWRGLAGLLLHFFGFGTTDMSYLFSHGYWYYFDHFDFWKHGGIARTAAFYADAGVVPMLWGYQLVGWTLAGAGLVFTMVNWLARSRRWRRLRQQPLAFFFLAALISIVVLYAISKKGGYAHYVTMLVPLAFLPTIALLSFASRFRVAAHLGAAYALAMPIVGALLLGAYYRLDSRMSIPQQKRIVEFILERTERSRPFELRFAWREGRPYGYERLARRLYRANWLARSGAPDVFTVMPRSAYRESSASKSGALVLETLAVVHARR